MTLEYLALLFAVVAAIAVAAIVGGLIHWRHERRK